MTPLRLATDADRSIAFLRLVVGYGRLQGETSALDDARQLSTQERATVLAWYWPQRGYREGFDPFTEFEAARTAEPKEGGRDPQLALRALSADRFAGFLANGSAATLRPLDEVAAAVCWRARCSGDQLLGVLAGTHGLAFDQLLATTDLLSLRYIDPADAAAHVPSWTSATAEFRADTIDAVLGTLRLAVELARERLTKRQIEQMKRDISALRELPDSWHRLMREAERLSERSLDLATARMALRERDPLPKHLRVAEVVGDLLLGPGAKGRRAVIDLLTDLLRDASPELLQIVNESFDAAATRMDAFRLDEEDVDQGFGWLLLDRRSLGGRIDEALRGLASISTAQSILRRRVGGVEPLSSPARPGDTYTAPAVGTNYRALYEALAASDSPVATLEVDPTTAKIRTDQGWIQLPVSAVRDRAWWSGGGRSAIGRPQVRAWWAAGYGTPQLTFNDQERVIAARFASLPGRNEWLTNYTASERISSGRYTVPLEPNIPFHAVLNYDDATVWRMDDEQYRSLGLSFSGARTAAAEPDAGHASRPTGNASSDADLIEHLTTHLREHGERGRREIEELLTSNAASEDEALEITKRIPNLLAKARRHGKIGNIGTRQHPRWVASGTPAHLAARLAWTLERDRHGNVLRKFAVPALSPGDPVPAELYRAAIRHAFPDLEPKAAATGATMVGDPAGRPYLTADAMSAVLAGLGLTNTGVELLLDTINRRREAEWESAASEADPGPRVFDEDELFVALEE